MQERNSLKSSFHPHTHSFECYTQIQIHWMYNRCSKFYGFRNTSRVKFIYLVKSRFFPILPYNVLSKFTTSFPREKTSVKLTEVSLAFDNWHSQSEHVIWEYIAETEIINFSRHNLNRDCCLIAGESFWINFDQIENFHHGRVRAHIMKCPSVRAVRVPMFCCCCCWKF